MDKMKTHVAELVTKDWLIKLLLAALIAVVGGAWRDLKDTRERMIIVETKVDMLLPNSGPPINPMGGGK